MKLPDFNYARPSSLEEAYALLRAPNARAIAGGQSLLPIMAFRLAAPETLVDIGRLPELGGIEVTSGYIRIGAGVRWNEIERHAELKAAFPLLTTAIDHVAHYQIKTRGTAGGSLAHADPASEFCGIAVTCDATIHVGGMDGKRSIPASSLFTGPLETSLKDGEIITAVEFPRLSKGRRWAFEEFARRRGDFALAGIAIHFEHSSNKVLDAHIGVIGANDRPIRLTDAEAALNGHALDTATIASTVAAARAQVQPHSDIHGSAEYRRSLVGTLLERSLVKTAQWSETP